MTRLTLLILASLAIVVTSGCDEREMAQQANEHAARQAAQNLEMARLNQQVAEGSKRLVEADAQMRSEFFQANQAIEQERKKLAGERYRDPIIAAALGWLGIVAASLVPLVACIYLLRSVGSSNDTADELSDLLVLELTSDQPKLLLRETTSLPALQGTAAEG